MGMRETTAQVTFRVPADLKAWLDDHGQRNQRNLTQTLVYLLNAAKDREQARSVTDSAPAHDSVAGGA